MVNLFLILQKYKLMDMAGICSIVAKFPECCQRYWNMYLLILSSLSNMFSTVRQGRSTKFITYSSRVWNRRHEDTHSLCSLYVTYGIVAIVPECC